MKKVSWLAVFICLVLTALLVGGYVLTRDDVRVPFNELPLPTSDAAQWRAHDMKPLEKVADIDPNEQLGDLAVGFLRRMPVGATIDGGWGEESYVKVWVKPRVENLDFEQDLVYSATALMAFSFRTSVVTFDSYTTSYTITRDDLTKVLLRDPSEFRSLESWERIRKVIPDIHDRILKKIPLPLAIDHFS
ncbi:hypothetical protein J2S49_000900 [Arcanobacterium wilhelmae]|uniref:DUF4825 domain-containing protein n=1 Tax=Arcanobacterium wilhelmae TaxID=1803177 RepID=A0ABT9NAT1_9ACTO|nr:hypothetical protein [Arcanobacterium wilhelmae]MDP9800824.1 hypothetical protein [Arcanobacterium wilhelmae]WFN90199.1 hypothetical protein P8A24_08440 [Arcanobacterium wilhelmae]